ncbi:MAG: peptide-methionine (S)-S-oxide reductase MsrA [Actinobacteria bacterium]|nr:peptide-methionine (S)-S-oxide reductase MsrA [Actinomycetota bacterium]
MNTETIILGGGCFWCTEAVFSMVKGITGTTVGYAGGTEVDPDYESVCGGSTGHAEVVSVTFDPGQVSLEELLELFFASHDPTTLNRQGADTGTQYRSLILLTHDSQKTKVEGYLNKAQADFDNSIVTEVAELGTFYPAEEYHQDYYEKNPDAPYCSSVISPKVEKIRKMLEK